MSRIASVLGLLALLARVACAELPVFTGDPVDPVTGAAYVILPGVPLVNPGPDGKYGTPDDIIEPAVLGDVDLVVRTGGGYTGGALPPPHPGVATAPVVVVGGTATATGSAVAFQGIVSDGQPPSVVGNLLSGPELNGRPVLAIAYADLDGDGFIGPTAADGDADDELERQEILAPVGRQAASIVNGIATGSLALYVGAPASVGGLAVVVAGGASTGTTPFLYFDGPWIATLLPYMPPLDPRRIIGGAGIGGPDPASLLADFELEIEKTFSPAPNHPILGTPYAIPVDGTSPTVDLVRSESGAAVGVACGRPVDLATFVASPTRRVHPAAGPAGGRALFEDADDLALASDGPGGAATVDCFLVDRLGNAADPPPGGFAVTLEAGPRLRIVSPDADGDPHTEPLAFTTASAVPVVVDDTGAAAATPVVDHVVAVRDGVPVGALRVTLAAGPGGGGSTPGPLGASRVRLRVVPSPTAARLAISARITPGNAPIDPGTQPVAFSVAAGPTTIYARTLPAGSLVPNGRETTFRFRDPATAGPGRIAGLSITAKAGTYRLRLRVRDADLTAASPGPGRLRLTTAIGASTFAADLPCNANRTGRLTTCEQ